ncbi:tyrosine/phenylalanine carboxypeptidase domain-containing protein [Phycisphaerales bacterium AB-hyl4]|uniref:Tyrosine/phenylalanine carboxypeptidase domain-containing protein n=1 Tax=Natronomicrosphaera hydrolytica TaxID=3242702 RepID=A0ABV4U6S6_9BACT
MTQANLDEAAVACDERLAEVAESFDALMDVTPTNEHAAWQAFKASRFEVEPELKYRKLSADPAVLKGRLFTAPVDEVNDESLAALMRARQVELEMQLNLLTYRNTPRFVLESEQVYGRPDDALVELAEAVLNRLPQGRPDFGEGDIDAETFATRAREVAAAYRDASDHFEGTVEVRDDVSTLITSHGKLLIDKHLLTPSDRVDALVHHEISVHLLTYFNGRLQPMRQFCTGFAGYELLQEGLAVLLEYLVNGMNEKRWRVLAARVVAVAMMLREASFVATFHRLHDELDVEAHTAFRTTMRVYRSGGLTKDIIYLLGFRELLAHLQEVGTMDVLFLGRFGLEQLPMVEDLRERGVLAESWLLPSPLNDADVQARLSRVRGGADVLSLVDEIGPR